MMYWLLVEIYLYWNG